ncbi:hypothetical protein BDW22DRAFT_405378 [Trametopsis cervina]|nr:hypothetical protein BDW22DRAFT_405378 [Trametopsis cervina]
MPLKPSPSSPDKPYKLETAQFKDEDFNERVHNLDPTAVRKTVNLGDICGLTKLGVHLVRIPPHSRSSTLHWHSSDDEWIYVLESGEAGATLVTLPKGEKDTREETIRKGDFVAWPAGSGHGHVISTGDEEVTFLCSGTREAMDVCTYPLAGKKLLIDRKGGPRWYADEANVTYATRV